MAHWGMSYASGPNYNLPWHRYHRQGRQLALSASYDAMQDALALAPQRKSGRAGDDPGPARAISASRDDQGHGAVGQGVYGRDAQGVLASPMISRSAACSPRRSWTRRRGRCGICPRATRRGSGTVECRTAPGRCLRANAAAWDHPGLLHLYVHLMEMSPFPEHALRAGDRLRTIVPGSGHLIHMPTHLDVLCGHYNDVLHLQSYARSVTDRRFLSLTQDPGRLPGLRHPQFPLRDLRRNVPRPVPPRRSRRPRN